MKRYFENTYPRRLEEFRVNLDVIAADFMKTPEEDTIELKRQIGLFLEEMKHFLENTKLHITAKKARMVYQDMRYIGLIRPQYIHNYLLLKGSKKAAQIYARAYSLDAVKQVSQGR